MSGGFYTYLHRRADAGSVFYVGKGKGDRAYNRHGRGRSWNSAAISGFTVSLLAYWPTEEEAFEHEKFLIACFRDLGAPLCNKTDGGEGSSGHVHTEETRKIIRAMLVGLPKAKSVGPAKPRKPHSAETRAKLSERAKARAPEVVAAAIERLLSPESREKRRVAAQNLDPVAEKIRREKLSAAAKEQWGRYRTEGTGWTHTPEARRKMSEASLARWEKAK